MLVTQCGILLQQRWVLQMSCKITARAVRFRSYREHQCMGRVWLSLNFLVTIPFELPYSVDQWRLVISQWKKMVECALICISSSQTSYTNALFKYSPLQQPLLQEPKHYFPNQIKKQTLLDTGSANGFNFIITQIKMSVIDFWDLVLVPFM